MHTPIIHCKLANGLCTELRTTVLNDDIRYTVRCEDFLQDVDKALRRQAVKTFALDPLRVVFDHDEIDFATQFEQVHRKSLTWTRRE